MLKIRQSHNRLILNMGIPIPGRVSLYYTPAQRSWRGVYWIHLVRLSVRPSVRLSVDDMVFGT